MTETGPNLVLVLLVGVLVGTGVYLLLERSLTRVLIGIGLLSNGVNVLILHAGGAAGGPPLIGSGPEEEMADPLPQALVLTAIVITLGMTGFVLAMAYRHWQLLGHDEVQDDVEDRRIARRVARGVLQRSDFTDVGTSLAEDAAEARDDTAHRLPVVRDEIPTGAVHADDGPHPAREPHHEARLAADDEEAER
jgi:multicomponent Na+:H+ antiporter subunit C